MTLPPRPAPGEQACAQCAAPLAADQHWCVVCGARQASARSDALALLFAERRAAEGAGTPAGAPVAPARPVDAARRRRAAVPAALAALVGLFVVSGTSVSALAGSSQPPFTVVLPPQVAQQVAQAPPPADEPLDEAPLDDTPLDDGSALADETPVEEAPAAETPAAAEETPADEDSGTDAPADGSPIQHVFLIVLGSTDVAALSQDETAAPYLAGTLAKSGTLLSGFTTVARGALANRIALVSGQGPTPQTLADCTAYGDVRPADPLDAGQTGGDGCVYGFETGHVGDQLRGLEKTWKAYTEPAAGAAVSCRADASTTRRNPFLWFGGTVEADDCDERNVPLSQLERDLRDAETTPALAWIASDAQQGSADADAFLERVVPQIQNSLAYANGGLIVITSDQPPAAAPDPAAPTAPAAPPAATTPAAPPATTDPAAPPATTDPTPPPTATPPATTTPTTTTPTTPTDPPAAATTTTSTTPAPRARAAADPEVPVAAPPPTLAPGPTRYPNVGGALAAGGGQRVGALLISPYTPSGRVDATPANAFTLLRTIEQIFGADPIGYAADPAVRPLPDALFSVTP